MATVRAELRLSDLSKIDDARLEMGEEARSFIAARDGSYRCAGQGDRSKRFSREETKGRVEIQSRPP
jgi:hypothetical protein